MEKNLTLAQKIELARWIEETNYRAILLTGSLMLHLRGIDLGREPQDIDFLIRDDAFDPDFINLPPWAKKISEEETPDGYVVRARFMYFGTKIEFLTVVNRECFTFNKENEVDGIYLASVEGLLAAKKEYVANDTSEESKEKHRRDIEIIEKWLAEKNK